MFKFSCLKIYLSIIIPTAIERRILSSLKLLLISISFLLTINNTYALGAETTDKIIGSPPYLLFTDGVTKLNNIGELVGFIMPKRDGSGGTEQITDRLVNTMITIPAGSKFSDVVLFVTPDTKLHYPNVIVGDVDGDADIASNTSFTGSMRATWFVGGEVLPVSNLNEKFLPCGGPYTLRIEVPSNFYANTKYGYPNFTSYGSYYRAEYHFISSDRRFCYLRPHNMEVYTDHPYKGDLIWSEGYNPAVWVPRVILNAYERGFKPDSGFPTTGFEKAQFTLVGSGVDQKEYRCSSPDDGGKISLSSEPPKDGAAIYPVGENCTVTYNSKTKADFIAGGTPNISMEYNTGKGWKNIGNFHIPVPDKWAISKGEMHYANAYSIEMATVFYVLDACRGVTNGTSTKQQALGLDPADQAFRQRYLFRRDEISNGPHGDHVKYPEGSSSPLSAGTLDLFSRDVGTFAGEWGKLDQYSGSPWIERYYWTGELWNDKAHLYYISYLGALFESDPVSVSTTAICRGN